MKKLLIISSVIASLATASANDKDKEPMSVLIYLHHMPKMKL